MVIFAKVSTSVRDFTRYCVCAIETNKLVPRLVCIYKIFDSKLGSWMSERDYFNYNKLITVLAPI